MNVYLDHCDGDGGDSAGRFTGRKKGDLTGTDIERPTMPDKSSAAL